MMENSSDILIRVRGLEKHYHHGKIEVEALRGVDLDVRRGSLIVFVGPSGGGKTTLLHLLGGMDRPSAGEIRMLGERLDSKSEHVLTNFRRDHIGFIFQSYNLLPSLNALDNVILPLLAKGMAWKKARQCGRAFLERVGLGERLRHTPGELSGGEQQRVAIARALVGEPSVILADEPTGDLDSSSAGEIIELMVSLNQQQGITFIVATHNRSICQHADHTYEMQDGRLLPELERP